LALRAAADSKDGSFMKNVARMRRSARLAVALTAVGLTFGPAACTAAELTATPANLRSVFGSAKGGDTILLAPGSYGSFEGGMKSGMVTLKAQPGATVRMNLRFNPASNITIDGVTLDEVDIANRATKDIVVRNSDIPGQVIFHTGELANANILFDNNDHHDFSKCDQCAEGRVSLLEHTDQPSGITIQNSQFRGGMSDGISNGANGLRILNNVFHDLVPGTPDGVHTDAIQLFGSKNTLIKGNYMYNVHGQQIMAPDGADHEIIEDNVIAADPDGYPFVISLGSDDGSIIRHNTFPDGSCAFNARCGIIALSAKSGNPKGSGTIIKDNVLGGAIRVADGSTAAEISHNLFASQTASTNRNMSGQARFAGGSRPTTYAGYALAPGSPGKGTASDGGDLGIRLTAAAPAPRAPSAATSPGVRVRVLTRLRTLARNGGRLRLVVTVDSARTIVLAGRVRPGRALDGQGGGHARATIKLKGRTVRFGRAGRRTLSFKLSRHARRVLARSRNAQLALQVYADAERTQAVRAFKLTIRR
jgi:hypothetical protein